MATLTEILAALYHARERRRDRSREPVVSSFDPTFGPVGTVVTIRGRYLYSRPSPPGGSGPPGVTFNGEPATEISVESDSLITVEVPVGATTGDLVVTNQAGSTTAGTFTVA